MRAILVTTVVSLLATAATASACTTYSTSTPEVDAAGLLYVDADCTPILSWGTPCDLFIVWIYQETNGVPGLQRGDAYVDDTCGLIPSDTLIF